MNLSGCRDGAVVRALSGLPPMWLGFDSQTQRHLWVEVVGSLFCSERCFSGYSGFPSPQKQTIDVICVKSKVKWCIYIAPLSQVSKALYNDQFTPSGLEAYTGANCSRF